MSLQEVLKVALIFNELSCYLDCKSLINLVIACGLKHQINWESWFYFRYRTKYNKFLLNEISFRETYDEHSYNPHIPPNKTNRFIRLALCIEGIKTKDSILQFHLDIVLKRIQISKDELHLMIATRDIRFVVILKFYPTYLDKSLIDVVFDWENLVFNRLMFSQGCFPNLIRVDEFLEKYSIKQTPERDILYNMLKEYKLIETSKLSSISKRNHTLDMLSIFLFSNPIHLGIFITVIAFLGVNVVFSMLRSTKNIAVKLLKF